MPFDGLRVVSFESRRAAEMAELIRRQGGDPFVAPSMRESPIENNPEAFEFAERLFRGEFDLMIFLTGVGTRALDKVLASRYPEISSPMRCGRSRWPREVPNRWPRFAKCMFQWPSPRRNPIPGANLLVALDGRAERHIALAGIRKIECGAPGRPARTRRRRHASPRLSMGSARRLGAVARSGASDRGRQGRCRLVHDVHPNAASVPHCRRRAAEPNRCSRPCAAW